MARATKKPSPSALTEFPDLVTVVSELTDDEVAMIRDTLSPREVAELDAARSVAAKKRRSLPK
jgi:hypothetical protein